MTKGIKVRTGIASAVAALALAIGVAPTAALAEEPIVAQLASADAPSSLLAQSLHAFIDQDAAKVYAATARANGDEAEAQAIEAQAAAAVAAVDAQMTDPVVPITVAAAEAATEEAAPAQEDEVQAEALAEEAPAELEAPVPNTIEVGGSVIPFVDYYLAPTAPESTAGLWWGDDSTTDNELGYFIGHNPGVFAPVISLNYGDTATVTDGNGNTHTYTVIDIFDVPNTTTLQDIQPRILGHGESIVMQACIQGGAFYRVVVAA